MKSQKVDQHYLIVLDKGEDLVASLTSFCQENKIQSGYLNGIGALSLVELGIYDLKNKKYITKTYEDEVVEIVNLFGTISETKLHMHIILGDPEMNTFGGHLNKGTIGVTAEIILVPGSASIKRKMNEEVGLELMDLE